MGNWVIYESICRSKSLAKCSGLAQDNCFRFLLYANSWGRFEVDLDKIKRDIFPYRKGIDSKTIARLLREYKETGHLFIWTINGRIYAQWVNWDKFTGIGLSRRGKSNIPDPPKEELKSYLDSSCFNLNQLDSNCFKLLQLDSQNKNKNLNKNKKEIEKEEKIIVDRIDLLISNYSQITGKKIKKPEIYQTMFRARILETLKNNPAYTFDELLEIPGLYMQSEFHMGKNASGKEYLDLRLMYRNDERVLKVLDWKNKPKDKWEGFADD